MDIRFNFLNGKVQALQSTVQYLHVVFLRNVFYGFTGSLLCLNISLNYIIYIRCYRLCNVFNCIRPFNILVGQVI